MAISQGINSAPALRIPLTGRCGDRRVVRGWALVRDDEFGRELLRQKWQLKRRDYVTRGVGTPPNHRIVHLHHAVYEHYHGPVPDGLLIDHADCDPLNNTPENLRALDASQSQVNRRRLKRNTTGHVGVWWNEQYKRWRAAISVRRRSVYLGHYLTIEEAAAAVNHAYAHYWPHVPPPNNIQTSVS